MTMTLEKCIAFGFLLLCFIYGYEAFRMDADLLPFQTNKPVLPSTMPKVISILGGIAALVILISPPREINHEELEINYRRLGDYNWGQALLLIGLMVVYAYSLRPFGFIFTTTGFLLIGSFILGERRYLTMILSSVIASLVVWWLVDQQLGVFLRAFPWT